PAPREGRLPLSFAQQRLWFLEQLGGLGGTYHMPMRLRLRGGLDRDALVGALDGIVARHEALRTTFAQVDGVPEQRIAPAAASGFHLVEHDLGGAADAEAELGRWMAEEAGAPFDLERGPLIRGRLIRLAADDHVLLLTMHHIVSDGWSMGVLTGELSALYAAHARGTEARLPALPVQYADYAAWQRRWVEGEVLEAQAEYWTRTLEGAPELLELPTDRPRPAQVDHAGAMLGVELDEALAAELKALSRRHGTTLFMTLLAGWAVVLGRLSGQAEVVVGTPAAGRGRREIEGLIGFFVNTLALRIDLSGAPSVADVLARVKERALRAQQNQDIPFEQVVERVDPVRSLSHSPLFQVMFAWQDTQREGGLSLPGLDVGRVGVASSHVQSQFDLSLSLRTAGDRIVGSVTYATALFERESVERWADSLRRVLQEMVADESRPVERLALMPAEERARVVEEWNRTEADFPREACLHELIEAQVRRTPGAVAVVLEGEELTYAELNARANRLAHHLIAHGVGPDVRVGVCADRSLEMMVALLGVLKAGGAYVPLDPGYPAERLAYMLADSTPAAVLAQQELRGRVEHAGVPVLELDASAPAWADRPTTDPERGALTPDHLAYVIYTSGSTGRPKGVGVQHRGVVNRLSWMEAVHGLGPRETVLQKTPYSFDVSVWELFWPLAAGARLVLARPGGHRDPAYLLEVVRRERITTVHFVPSLLAAFLAHPDAERGAVPELRRVVSSGEALPPELVARFGERLPGVELHNLYGPTEASVDVTFWRCPTDGSAARVSIGRPVPNARIYLLDPGGEPVPVGVPGELYIGGVQVARGYLGRAGLTAERFVADPFGGEPGARLYRTGDRARWLADGTIEYLGRIDFQVKVRGFRIEPGEIEARLREHPGVREAVVLAREDAPGQTRLVAYLAGGEGVEADALRAHVGAALPEHMVPSAYVRLEQWPLTPSGKLDRKALPAPGGDAFARRGYEAPVGETEQALAEIWAEVLRVERVGRRDNFFELGGHSLLAVQVTARMRQALQVQVRLGDIFSHPTVEALAARVRGTGRPAADDRAIAIRPAGSQPPLFLVYEGGGSTAYAQVLHPHIDGDIPVYALPAPPADAPLRTVEGMATRLVRRIREVQPSGPYRLAGWSFGGVLAYETASQLIGQDEIVEFVGMFDSYCPTHPSVAPREATAENALLFQGPRIGEAGNEGGRTASGEETGAAGEVDLETFVARLRQEGRLPGHATAAQFRETRDRRRIHQHALRGYSPQPIPVAVHLFPARESAEPDLSRGWRALLPERSLQVTPVPGTHTSMMQAPNAASLGEALSRRIDQAWEGGKAPAGEGYAPVVKLRGGKPGCAPTFCVPGAGTSVASFVELSGCLHSTGPVLGLQPRGLDAATVPHSTVQAAAEHYLRAVHEAGPEGPVHLLGHSFGGWVAFEMALRLRQAGRPVASLTILDSDVPDQDEGSIREYDGVEAFLKLVEILELTAERPLGIACADAGALDEAGRLKLLHCRMLRYGLISARSTYQALYGPLRTFARCLRTTYRPSGVYPGPLRLVLVPDPRRDEEANRAQFAETVRGWRRWAPGLVFSAGAGNHVTALKPPHVASLAAFLAEDRR
ncbi:MAG TPA: amino acid adenylation domain-containing protein, partial [Longimicrobium sp.]|nr:amino acid adenylation domain-containing protein [Longimicrobium sp.]